ncbi:unnamed protein product [Prunus armeniaca]
MPDLEALLLSVECRLQSSSSPVICYGATAMVASYGGRSGHGFGDLSGFASRGPDRRNSFSPSRPSFSSGRVPLTLLISPLILPQINNILAVILGGVFLAHLLLALLLPILSTQRISYSRQESSP